MLFPPTQRVIYHENPLVEVVCQFRFPTILKIDAEIPVAFQEAVRSTFPDYTPTVEHAHNVELTDTNGQTDTHTSHTTTNHAFISADRKWRVNLTSGFIALSTLNYKRWEEFRDMLAVPLQALMSIYAPSHFNRVGLRYTDAIDRIGLGLGTCRWTDLVKPEMLGMLASATLPESVITHATQVSELRLDDETAMVINAGLGSAEGKSNPCLIVDTDTFTTATHTATTEAALEVLDGLHAPISNYFQWAIQPKLHAALGPEDIKEV